MFGFCAYKSKFRFFKHKDLKRNIYYKLCANDKCATFPAIISSFGCAVGEGRAEPEEFGQICECHFDEI